ncbi:helix-turn-helix domain-containing protein [Rhodomicrobium vannielii]|uniref:helix-turn-helix transcriptional regulator n=1 Tax=Rhodomicrobium vannielii TaxID=1069 RepID=UPI0031BAA6E4
MTATKKMRTPEAARYLGLAVSTLARLRCLGGGPRYAKAGKRTIIYDRADLDGWLATRLHDCTREYTPN